MRDVLDLEKNALKFWPTGISGEEKDASIIPLLLKTQDKFISLLNIADADPFKWKEVLKNTKSLPANLFLKHLMVLSDIGGEKLMRFKRELPSVLNNLLVFSWDQKMYSYEFQTLLSKSSWKNNNLYVDGRGLSNPVTLTPMIEDVCMLLLYGGASTTENIPEVIKDRCVIGSMLGKSDEIETFVKQRYIFVSRITGGAEANALGQLAQKYVVSYLKENLPDWRINEDQLPKVSQNERTSLSVDIIAKSPKGKFCAIEVSFQVTTNSTIERKSGQAQSRYSVLHSSGHKIAYVIDGVGNFERSSALRTICQFSDCTVTFKDSELDKLVDFLKMI